MPFAESKAAPAPVPVPTVVVVPAVEAPASKEEEAFAASTHAPSPTATATAAASTHTAAAAVTDLPAPATTDAVATAAPDDDFAAFASDPFGEGGADPFAAPVIASSSADDDAFFSSAAAPGADEFGDLPFVEEPDFSAKDAFTSSAPATATTTTAAAPSTSVPFLPITPTGPPRRGLERKTSDYSIDPFNPFKTERSEKGLESRVASFYSPSDSPGAPPAGYKDAPVSFASDNSADDFGGKNPFDTDGFDFGAAFADVDTASLAVTAPAATSGFAPSFSPSFSDKKSLGSGPAATRPAAAAPVTHPMVAPAAGAAPAADFDFNSFDSNPFDESPLPAARETSGSGGFADFQATSSATGGGDPFTSTATTRTPAAAAGSDNLFDDFGDAKVVADVEW